MVPRGSTSRPFQRGVLRVILVMRIILPLMPTVWRIPILFLIALPAVHDRAGETLTQLGQKANMAGLFTATGEIQEKLCRSTRQS